jgi:hypothetical protein
MRKEIFSKMSNKDRMALKKIGRSGQETKSRARRNRQRNYLTK